MIGNIIKKELILIFRNLHAIAVLFIMPSLFILIMSLALKNNNLDNVKAVNTLYFYDLDSQSNELFLEELGTLASINLVAEKNDKDFIEAVQPNDQYPLLIYNENQQETFDKPLKIIAESQLNSQLVEYLVSQIDKAYTKTKMQAYVRFSLQDETVSLPENFAEDINKFASEKSVELLFFNAGENETGNLRPNSSQFSVPAWLIFGMFFIVIPLSNILLNEKLSNTNIRFVVAGVPAYKLICGKLIPYFIINLLQAACMFMIGVFLLPFFDIPALTVDGLLFPLFILTLATSLSCLGLAFLISCFSKSTEHAVVLGGGINILLAATGGIMVPVFIMPEIMHTIANFSPMYWSLSGFQKILLSHAGLENVTKNVILLSLFGIICIFTAILKYQKTLQDN